MQYEIIIGGEKITTVEELRDKFSLDDVCVCAHDSRLKNWLITIGEYEIASSIENLKNLTDEKIFATKLMEALGFDENQIEPIIQEHNLRAKQQVDKATETEQEKLHPILRKVLKIKKIVKDIILEILDDDISEEEFSWNLYLREDMGCTTVQLLSIQKRLIQSCQVPGQIFGTSDSKFDTDKTPFGIFFAIIENCFPERYTGRHLVTKISEKSFDNPMEIMSHIANIFHGSVEKKIEDASLSGNIVMPEILLADAFGETTSKAISSEMDAAVKKAKDTIDQQFGYHPEWLGKDQKQLGF